MQNGMTPHEVLLRRVSGTGSIALRFVQPARVRVETHFHETSTICIALDGAAEDRFGSRTVNLARGSVVFRPAGERHSHEYGRQGFSAVALQIPEPVLKNFAEGGTGIIHCSPAESSRGTVATALAMCADLHFSGDQWDKTAEDLLIEIVGADRAGAARPRSYPSCVRTAMEFIESNFSDACDYSEVARAAAVHPTHLARLFRQSAGTSIGQFRKRVRLRRAIEQLTQQRTTLANAAQECGFYDSAHLAHDLRRYLNVAPGELQKMLRIYKTGSSAVPRVS